MDDAFYSRPRIDKELLERKVILQQVAAGLEPALTTLLSAAERTFLSAHISKIVFSEKVVSL